MMEIQKYFQNIIIQTLVKPKLTKFTQTKRPEVLCAENLVQLEIESPYKYAKRPFEPNISEPSESKSSSSISASIGSNKD